MAIVRQRALARWAFALDDRGRLRALTFEREWDTGVDLVAWHAIVGLPLAVIAVAAIVPVGTATWLRRSDGRRASLEFAFRSTFEFLVARRASLALGVTLNSRPRQDRTDVRQGR